MYNNEQADELFNQETIEQPQTIVFNKLTGALVAKMFGDHLDLVNTTYCKGKVVTYNPDTHQYVGDYDTGSVMSKSETPRIMEEHSLDGSAGVQRICSFCRHRWTRGRAPDSRTTFLLDALGCHASLQKRI